MPAQQDQTLWQNITDRLVSEWHGLDDVERDWIKKHVRRLVRLQEQLHQLFIDVDGNTTCLSCQGGCCGHGKYHPNLANLLACLVVGHPFPQPDFGNDCPYCDAAGCQFPPGLRPFNCISFICEQIEDRLTTVNCEAFYRLERAIRQEYEYFCRRYVGAGLRGVLIRGELLSSYLSRR